VLLSDGTSDGAIAQSGFTYDGDYLTLIGSQRIQSDIDTGISSNTILHTVPVVSGCGAFFDYCISESGGAKRLGTVMTTWDDSGASWTDTSTPDLNTSTIGLGFTVTVSSGNANLNAVVTSGTWTIRLAIRIIY
jgi:hypothetical protein